MELQYKELLEQNNLEVSELSSEAKVLIDQLNSTLKGVNMLEKSGKSVSDKTHEKIQALDNIICREINEQLNDGENNSEEEEEEDESETQDDSNLGQEEENDEEEEKEEEEEEEEENEPQEIQAEIMADANDPKGATIDADLKIAYDGNKKTITMDELKSVSKTAYDIIFNSYDDSGDNGVVTSNYSLIETDENVFTLTKK